MERVFEKLKKLLEIIATKASSNMLGLIITENSIFAAEIDSNEACHILRSGEFSFKERTPLDKLSINSFAFKEFLEKGCFKARKAVVGISAKYLIVTPIELPAVKNIVQKNEIVRMTLETKLKIDLSEIAFDYYSNGGTSVAKSVAVSTMSKYTDSITAFLSECGISAISITGSSIGIDLQHNQGISCNIIIYPNTVEVVIFRDNLLGTIKYLQIEDDTKNLTTEITRIVSLIADSATGARVYVNDFTNSREELCAGIKKELDNVEILSPAYKNNDSSNSRLCQLAANIAENSAHHKNVQIDLLHGHALTNGQGKSYKKMMPKLGVVGVVLVVLIGIFLSKWHFDNKQVIKLQQQLSSIGAEAKEAKEIISRVGFAKTWFNNEPQYLDILRELTLSFPEKDGVWLSTMAVDESKNLVVTGKATREESVLDLLDNLNKNVVFENIKMLYMRKTGKNTEIITFAINLQVKDKD
jgi:Tfp pilus assembly protein PilN